MLIIIVYCNSKKQSKFKIITLNFKARIILNTLQVMRVAKYHNKDEGNVRK